MKAVIVAAGLSTRMYPMIKGEFPKCMLDIGNTSIIERAIDSLIRCGIGERDICIVVGYGKEVIELDILDYDITVIHNPFYEHCNNMASLWFAKDFVGSDSFIYLHGDLIFDTEILERLIHSPEEDMLVVEDKPCDEEDMKIIMNIKGEVIKSSKDIPSDEATGEWIGMAKFYRPELLFDVIDHLLEKKELHAYDTAAFNMMHELGFSITAYFIKNLPWIEIDFPKEYELACQMNWK